MTVRPYPADADRRAVTRMGVAMCFPPAVLNAGVDHQSTIILSLGTTFDRNHHATSVAPPASIKFVATWFAAGWSSCYLSAIRLVAARMKVLAIGCAQVQFGVNGDIGRQLDPSFKPA
ncbi:MAG: hypothetical protein WCA06_03265 [Terrimicrobiaceae bacterium]